MPVDGDGVDRLGRGTTATIAEGGTAGLDSGLGVVRTGLAVNADCRNVSALVAADRSN